MKNRRFAPTLAALSALSALLALPNAAGALELFEGNIGYDGDWLHVLDAGAMGDRVYWYDLGDDVSYRLQCATDDLFSSMVLDESEITTNYAVPNLGPGLYYFRAHEVHSSGASGSWSNTGTLEVVEDLEPPTAEIVSPLTGPISAGDNLLIELRVSDDTVLHVARFTINGEYAGTFGLKTENHKVKPSFGESRTVEFAYQIPRNAKTGSLEISVVVSDVTYKQVTATVVIGAEGDSSARGSKKRRKR